MRRFLELYRALDATTSTNAKVRALEAFFRDAPSSDAAWALALMTGRRPRRVVSAAALVRWARDVSGLDDWLFDECMLAVGDTAETISLLLDGVGACAAHEDASTQGMGLAAWMEERILPLRGADEAEQRERVTSWWRAHGPSTVFILCKLLTGGLRVGASKTLAIRGLARAMGRAPEELAHRLMGDWQPTPTFIESLARAESDSELVARGEGSRPYPFFLASPIEGAPGAPEAIALAMASDGATPSDRTKALGDAIASVLGDVDRYQLEWKWDGIRAQLIRRAGRVHLWSRGEESITQRFPEIVESARKLPDGCVLDGEVLAWRHARPMGFQSLQRRIAREDVSRAILASVPCVFMAYDVLERDGADVRERSTRERRAMLEGLLASPASSTAEPGRLLISPRVEAPTWRIAAELRSQSRERAVEGLMIKSLDALYRVGRVRGDWWKWKIEPYTADLVLVYAQPGHGRRAGLLTDYGFAAWNDQGSLVAVTKAYSGLNQREIEELDTWIRTHTRERFGPVRSVDAVHVFEIAFEGAAISGRNRSGIALRFPRIARWRRDKTPREADTLDSIRTLVAAHGAAPERGLFDQVE